MAAERPHRDFLAVPERRRWEGPLPKLYATLRREAWMAKGQWVWRVLPRGASVGMLTTSDAVLGIVRTELRISRREAPLTERARAAWRREVDVFRREFGIMDWPEVASSAERAVVMFREPGGPQVRQGELLDLPPVPPPSAIREGR